MPMYVLIAYGEDTHRLTSTTRAVYKHTQRASSVALFFTPFEIFSGLQSVKTKAYEYAIIYMSVPTARHFSRSVGVKTLQM